MKRIIQSTISGNYLIKEDSESGKESYRWTNDCQRATEFESEEEAINTIKRFGFTNPQITYCDENYGGNGG
jgi:hypothetical protein